jgi:hypothetical protein
MTEYEVNLDYQTVIDALIELGTPDDENVLACVHAAFALLSEVRDLSLSTVVRHGAVETLSEMAASAQDHDWTAITTCAIEYLVS